MKFPYFSRLLFAFLGVSIVIHNAHGQSLFQLPKVSTTPSSCISNEKGYMVYNTTDNKIYYCNGTNYQPLCGISTNFFSLDGYSIVSQGKIKLSGLNPNEGAVKDKVLTAVDDFGNVEWKVASGGSGAGSAGFSAIGTSPGGSNGQNFTGNTYTKLTIFNIEEFDDAAQFSGNTFTAATAGVYHFDIKLSIFPVTIPVPEATIATIQIRKNTSTNIRVSTQAIVLGGVDFNSSFNIKLAENDTIEIYAGTTAGYTMKINGGLNLSFGGYKVY
ncbi:hypothetical protein [Runella aurantiaca]|nr:hypothetical protein [Runella aurantiaca]